MGSKKVRVGTVPVHITQQPNIDSENDLKRRSIFSERLFRSGPYHDQKISVHLHTGRTCKLVDQLKVIGHAHSATALIFQQTRISSFEKKTF